MPFSSLQIDLSSQCFGEESPHALWHNLETGGPSPVPAPIQEGLWEGIAAYRNSNPGVPLVVNIRAELPENFLLPLALQINAANIFLKAPEGTINAPDLNPFYLRGLEDLTHEELSALPQAPIPVDEYCVVM